MTHSWLRRPPQSYSDWLKHNPTPDLQKLAEEWDGLGRVPEAIMQTFEAARAEWETKRKNRHLDPPETGPIPEPVDHIGSEPGEDIPAHIMERIEAECKARSIGLRLCLKKGEVK
jgi:hypothetical protein